MKAILVNVFGGIVDCSIIANGVVNASNSLSLKIPLIVRLEGQNVEQAKQILKDSGLDIMRYDQIQYHVRAVLKNNCFFTFTVPRISMMLQRKLSMLFDLI